MEKVHREKPRPLLFLCTNVAQELIIPNHTQWKPTGKKPPLAFIRINILGELEMIFPRSDLNLNG